jgi:hypothetical protein
MMPLQWSDLPDDCVVVEASRWMDGNSRVVVLGVRYSRGGSVVGTRSVRVDVGALRTAGMSEADASARFEQLWNALPPPAAGVLAAIRSQTPECLFETAWRS